MGIVGAADTGVRGVEGAKDRVERAKDRTVLILRNLCVCMCVCMYVCMCVCICVCMCVYVYICVCMCMCVCV